ncbi:MAG: hypothetical protein JXD22_13280 [Sedimentisphaerales bacterium]|nr:hypothetical protein [Sedimentisphaerales bacterium]
MVQFSQDVDILKWEPNLFCDLARPDQTLCEGDDGELNGTTFTSSTGAFESCGLSSGKVIYLNDNDAINGCYEIVSVDSATQLTVSVLRADGEEGLIAPPSGSGIGYRVSSFDPQAQEVACNLLSYFGIKVNGDETEVTAANVLANDALRQASAYAVMSVVFAGCAYGEDDECGFWQKSLHYQKLFDRARSRALVELDLDGDALGDRDLSGGSVRLKRG